MHDGIGSDNSAWSNNTLREEANLAAAESDHWASYRHYRPASTYVQATHWWELANDLLHTVKQSQSICFVTFAMKTVVTITCVCWLLWLQSFNCHKMYWCIFCRMVCKIFDMLSNCFVCVVSYMTCTQFCNFCHIFLCFCNIAVGLFVIYWIIHTQFEFDSELHYINLLSIVIYPAMILLFS